MELLRRLWGVRVRTQFISFGICPVACFCEHCNEPFSSLKGGIFLNKLSDYQRVKKDSGLFKQCSITPLTNKLLSQTFRDLLWCPRSINARVHLSQICVARGTNENKLVFKKNKLQKRERVQVKERYCISRKQRRKMQR
jgi:hypothetical protein